MKKFVYFTIMSVLLLSCNDDDAPAETENVAPTTPVLVAPVNNKLCISNSLTFQWEAAVDANNDAIVYKIQIAKDKDFLNIVFSGDNKSLYQNVNLEKATAYYWRVKSTDSKNVSSAYSTVFSFYTSGDGVINYLPFLPDLVAPELNSVINATTAELKWTAIDVDKSNILAYDVYFGTTNPPTDKVGDNQNSTYLNVTVSASKEYFWKVVVKDDKGGVTNGQIWRFRTN